MLLCSVILWVGTLMLKYTGVSILVYELHLIKRICYWITHCLKINVYKSWNAYLWRWSLPVYARWSKMWFRSTLKDEKSNNLTGVRCLQKYILWRTSENSQLCKTVHLYVRNQISYHSQSQLHKITYFSRAYTIISPLMPLLLKRPFSSSWLQKSLGICFFPPVVDDKNKNKCIASPLFYSACNLYYTYYFLQYYGSINYEFVLLSAIFSTANKKDVAV